MSIRFSTSFAITLLAAAIAAPAAAGLYVEQTVSSSDQRAGMNMRVRAWAEADKAKVEFVDSSNEIMPAGSYLLTTDGGRTVYLVNPVEQTYSTWDIAQIFAMVGQMEQMTGGMVELDFKDPESESLESGPGGELLGYDTTRSRWRSAYTMDLKMAFMNQSSRMETVTEAWITDDIDFPALKMWFTANPPTTGDPELDEILTSEMSRVDGMVLKMTQDSTTTNKKGRGSSSSMTMEVTTLREESVSDDVFAMPEGYTETPLIPTMAGAEGQEKDQGPLGGLKGMFGRKKKGDG